MKYGKFATAEELLAGYVSLEKEFTKKCQALAELAAQTAVTAKPEIAEKSVQTEKTATDTVQAKATGKASGDNPAQSAETEITEKAESITTSATAQDGLMPESDIKGTIPAENTDQGQPDVNSVGAENADTVLTEKAQFEQKETNADTQERGKEQIAVNLPDSRNNLIQSGITPNPSGRQASVAEAPSTEEIFKRLKNDENFIRYLLNSKEIANRFFAQFAGGLGNNAAPPILTVGNNFVSCPTIKPKTLEQASKLINHFIEKR